MHILVSLYSLATAASLASASACRPTQSSSSALASIVSSSFSSSSSISVIASSSSVSSSASISSSASPSSSSSLAPSSSSSSATPLATFHVVASDPGNSYLDGQLLESYADPFYVEFASLSNNWVVSPLTIEAGTSYLKIGSYYIGYIPSSNALYSVTQTDLASYGMKHLVCSQAYKGVALSCYPVGYPANTEFFVNDAAESNIHVFMLDPSGSLDNVHLFNWVPQAV